MADPQLTWLDKFFGGSGAEILKGTGAPDSSLGNIGDLYFDQTPGNEAYYGPRDVLGWGSRHAIGGGSSPGVPDGSIQYRISSSAQGGAANAGIDVDGFTAHRPSATGGVATVGDDRFPTDSSVYARNQAGDANLCVWASLQDVLVVGYNGYPGPANMHNGVTVAGNWYSAIQAGNPATENFDAAVSAWGHTYFDHIPLNTGWSYPNFMMSTVEKLFALDAASQDPSGGGKGLLILQNLWGATTGNPPAGIVWVYPDPTTGKLTQKMPDGTVYDLTATGGGGSAAGAAGKIQGSNGSGGFTAPGPYAGADYISLIAGTPDGPGVRIANNTVFAGRNFGDAADIVACYIDSANQVRIGSAFDATQAGITFGIPSGGGHRLTINFGTLAYAYLDEIEFAVDVPRHGYTTPYASEGRAPFAVTASSHTLTPTEWTRRIIKFTGTFGGTSTITFPAPPNADASYVKYIRNTSTTALTLTIGSGATYAVAAGANKEVTIEPDGVFGP